MKYTIRAFNVFNQRADSPVLTIKVDSPKTCPICKYAWQPIYVGSTYQENEDGHDYFYLVNVVWMCPNCNKMSFSIYEADDDSGDLTQSFPNMVPKPKFYEKIVEISPSFTKIYHQALIAETLNLYEIAGMGYRKALEFLVKDYAIKNNPNNKENISKADLSKCIKDYIANPRAEAVMERTAWIGNDQTHYVKLHTNMDLKDLKALLDLSLSYITMELQTDEAIKIPKKKR